MKAEGSGSAIGASPVRSMIEGKGGNSAWTGT